MIWFFITLLAVAVGGVIATGILSPTRAFAVRVVGLILGVSLLIVLTVLLWKHAIVALAIASVCSLAIGVMFQKVNSSKAITGAITALVLIFVFTWLALQMGDWLIFERESDLSRWLKNFWEDHSHLEGYNLSCPGFLVALGFATLAASCLLERWMRAIGVFAGSLLALSFTPTLLANHGLHFGDMFCGHDPAFKLAVLCVTVIGIAGLFRLIARSGHSTKSRP